MQKEAEVNIGTVLQTISRMEHELQMLRIQVAKLASQQNSKRRGTRKTKVGDKAKPKSLYGIFPPSNTTMEDFRDARASWTRNLDREP